jgi:(R,R)-butanediol dehydrogenase/meso-butanediol dehydrogenase/diacetyl reductase/L-iditol 2-dehydrogenase
MEEYKKLKWTDAPDPVISDPQDILLQVKAVAICGSDVHGFDGSTGRRRPPLIMGHEAAGVVLETVSGVRAFKKGDKITFDSTIYCGTCWYCRRGEVNLCEHRRVLGVSCEEYRQDGAFAEYLVIPERIAVPLPTDLSWEEAACTEPVGVAAHGVTRTPLALNDTTAVVGSGLIGCLVIQILKAGGSGRVIALDTDPARREAAAFFGADEVLAPGDPDLETRVRTLTEGRGIDRAFEAVGASASINTAIAITRKGGTVTLVGNSAPRVEIPLQSVVTRQIGLLGSCAIAGEYPLALDLMARKKIDVRSLISATAPLKEGDLWMNRLYNREGNLLKVVLMP